MSDQINLKSAETESSNQTQIDISFEKFKLVAASYGWNSSKLRILSELGQWQLSNGKTLTGMNDIQINLPQLESEIKASWPGINALLSDLSRLMIKYAELEQERTLARLVNK